MTEIVPHGYISVSEAVNRLGPELFPEAWTGKEHEARKGLTSEDEWLAPARGGDAPGSAPAPIAAPVATALHPTGDPSGSSYQEEYRARKRYENACYRLRALLETADLEAAILDPFTGKLHRASTSLWRRSGADRMIEKGRAPIPHSLNTGRGQEIPRTEPAQHAITHVKNRRSDRGLAGKSSERKSNAAPAKGFRAQEVPELPGDRASIWRDISESSSADWTTEKVRQESLAILFSAVPLRDSWSTIHHGERAPVLQYI
jgi:hypothetical protein